jgi:hypothetical protein
LKDLKEQYGNNNSTMHSGSYNGHILAPDFEALEFGMLLDDLAFKWGREGGINNIAGM